MWEHDDEWSTRLAVWWLPMMLIADATLTALFFFSALR